MDLLRARLRGLHGVRELAYLLRRVAGHLAREMFLFGICVCSSIETEKSSSNRTNPDCFMLDVLRLGSNSL